jgi:hypothetical protein
MTEDKQENKQQAFQISFAEIDKVLSLFEKLADGINKVSNLPKEKRENLRKALSETAEMVVTILTTIKQTISIIIIGIRSNDPNIKTKIIELEHHSEWESVYRKFHLCEALKNASTELKSGFFSKVTNYFSFSNPEELERTIEQFMDNEFVVGIFVSKVLKNLAKLDKEADKNPAFVLGYFENARDDIEKYRDKFIEIEKNIRASI